MGVFEGSALYVCGVGGVGILSIQWVVVFPENVIARPLESQLKLKVEFQRVPYNQTFDFVTVCEDFVPGIFVKILSPACSWKMLITFKPFGLFW